MQPLRRRKHLDVLQDRITQNQPRRSPPAILQVRRIPWSIAAATRREITDLSRRNTLTRSDCLTSVVSLLRMRPTAPTTSRTSGLMLLPAPSATTAPISSLPKGAQAAVLMGDPSKAGEVIVRRLKFPANYQIPPHTHPYAENITVISSSVGFGMGEKLEKKGELTQAGAFHAQPARHPHYIWTGNEEAIIQVQFTSSGGASIDYINPTDD